MRTQGEALFNCPNLGNIKGGVAPFFNIPLSVADQLRHFHLGFVPILKLAPR